jgi:hypothetical protein
MHDRMVCGQPKISHKHESVVETVLADARVNPTVSKNGIFHKFLHKFPRPPVVRGSVQKSTTHEQIAKEGALSFNNRQMREQPDVDFTVY